MARNHAAISGKSFLRLLPFVSAVVLLAGMAVPARATSDSVADQMNRISQEDRDKAIRDSLPVEQDLTKKLNDSETDQQIRANQAQADQRAAEQEAQQRSDADRKAAEDKAAYQRAQAAAKAAQQAKSEAAPAPKPSVSTPATDAAEAMLKEDAKKQAAAEAAHPPVAPSPEQQAIDAAAKAAQTLEPAKAAEVQLMEEPKKAPARKGAKKDSPGVKRAKAKAAAKAQRETISDILDDYDAYVLDEAIASVNTSEEITKSITGEADSPMLSLNSIVMFALDQNPDVDMAKARKEQAVHNLGRAKAALYPHVDMTMEQSLEYNSPAAGISPAAPYINPSDRVAVVLEQLIYDGSITSNTIKQREEAINASGLNIEANTKDVLSTSVQQYLNVLRYQNTLRDSQKFMVRLREIADVINTTYQMGGSAKNDVEYAESRMAAAESGLENVRSSLNDALSNLESLTGPLPAFLATPPDELDPERVKLDEYVKLAQENNTDVLTNESDLQTLKYKLKSDKGTFMPRVNLVMSGEKTYDDGGPVGRDLNGKATLQMSYSIFDGFEGKENVKRTQAMISEIEIKRKKIMDDLRKQLRLSYNQMLSLQNNISKTKAEINSSEALQNLNRQNFEQGSISLIELIEGEERLNNARGRLHQQESDMYLSAYKLLIEVGIMKKTFFCKEC